MGEKKTEPDPSIPSARTVFEKVIRHAEPVVTSPWFVVGVLVLAAVLRLAHVLALRSSPWFDSLQLDHAFYDQWAQRIAAGEGAGKGAFFVDPLYSYFLALLYKLAGRDFLFVRLVQVALGVGTCYFVAFIGRRIYGVVVGNVACLIAALFVPAIYYESMIEKTALSVFLITLALTFYLGRSWKERLVSGVALGLAVLTRANLVLFVPLGFLALVFLPQRRVVAAPGNDNRKPKESARSVWQQRWRVWAPRLRPAGAFLGGAMVILGMVMLRNHRMGGQFVLTTANLGQNLFIGNNINNTSATYRPPRFVRSDPRFEQADFRKEAEARVGRSLNAKEVSDYWMNETWKHVRNNPGFALKMIVRKFTSFWNNYEIPDNNNIRVMDDFSWVLRFPLVWFGWIVPLAVLAAVVSFRKRHDVQILVGYVVLYCLTIVAVFVFSRFRVHIAPVLFVLTAYGGSWLFDQIRRARWKPAAYGGLLVLAVGVFSFVGLGWQNRKSALAIGYQNLGSIHVQQGRSRKAIETYERAVKISPRSVIGGMRTLGELYLRLEEFEAAEAHMQRVVVLKPESRRGWNALVRLYKKMSTLPDYSDRPEMFHKLADACLRAGRIAEARQAAQRAEALGKPLPSGLKARLGRAERIGPSGRPGTDAGLAGVYLKQAKLMMKQGRWKEAIEQLKQANRVGPYNENARYTLGSLMIKHLRPDETIAYYKRTVRSDPKPQTSHYFWGVALMNKGRLVEAIEKFKKALEIDPAHEMSQNQWGVAAERQGRLDEAIVHYKEAIEIHPEFATAHKNLARTLMKKNRVDEAKRHFDLARRSKTNTPRQFFYWGRYLFKKGRYTAAIAELKKAVDADPANKEAQALLEAARTKIGTTPSRLPGRLTRAQRRAMVEKLTEGTVGPVWFATYTNDPKAVALQRELEGIFKSSGWRVRSNRPVSFRLKPGVLFFMADVRPPRYAFQARVALEAAGLKVIGGSGYRAYYREMKLKNPRWRGFKFGPEQTYLVVIGRQP